MDKIYVILLSILFGLLIIDLVVGVSRDAINFLNAGISISKIFLKMIFIVSIIGVLLGLYLTSGMMEFAIKNTFNPETFQFDEIMVAFTAAISFVSVMISTSFIYIEGGVIAIFLVLLIFILLLRNFSKYQRFEREKEKKQKLRSEDLSIIQHMSQEGSISFLEVVLGVQNTYSEAVHALALCNLQHLINNHKKIEELNKHASHLKYNVLCQIKSMDKNTVDPSRFCILILDSLQEMVHATEFISTLSIEHLSNDHKSLRFNQIRDLKKVDSILRHIFNSISAVLNKVCFENLENIVLKEAKFIAEINEIMEKKIVLIRTIGTVQKNTLLYRDLLIKSKDLAMTSMEMLMIFKEFYSNEQ